MHRVFRAPADTAPEYGGPEVLRSLFRSVGLTEEPSGPAFLYYCRDHAGAARQFATLWGNPRRATVYLYPDALDSGSGRAEPLYRALDEAGVDLGAKLGPSIGIDLQDTHQLELFCEGITALLGATWGVGVGRPAS